MEPRERGTLLNKRYRVNIGRRRSREDRARYGGKFERDEDQSLEKKSREHK